MMAALSHNAPIISNLKANLAHKLRFERRTSKGKDGRSAGARGSPAVDSLLFRDLQGRLWGGGPILNGQLAAQPAAQGVLSGADHLRPARGHLVHQIGPQADQGSRRFFIRLLEALAQTFFGILEEGIDLLAEFLQATAGHFLRLSAHDIEDRFHQLRGAPLELSEPLLDRRTGNWGGPRRRYDRRRHGRRRPRQGRGWVTSRRALGGKRRRQGRGWVTSRRALGGRRPRQGRGWESPGRAFVGRRRRRRRVLQDRGREPCRALPLSRPPLHHGLRDDFPIRRRVGHAPQILRFYELDGNVVAGNSRLRIPDPDADTFPRRPGLGTFHGNEHADHDSIGGSDLAAVQVYDGGLSKLAKGTSRCILARKEHRRDEINPCAPPPAGSGVLRGCCLREGVVIHIRLAIRQAVATCSAGPIRGTHHLPVRTTAPPGCGLSPRAYSTGDILQIVGSSSNYSVKYGSTLGFHPWHDWPLHDVTLLAGAKAPFWTDAD